MKTTRSKILASGLILFMCTLALAQSFTKLKVNANFPDRTYSTPIPQDLIYVPPQNDSGKTESSEFKVLSEKLDSYKEQLVSTTAFTKALEEIQKSINALSEKTNQPEEVEAPVASVWIDDDAVKQLFAGPDEEIEMYAPSWCSVCKELEPILGEGDENVKIKVLHKEISFTLPNNKGYPVFYNRKTNKYMSGRLTLPELLDGFGIPKRTAAITVGTIPRSLLNKGLWLIKNDGPINVPNDSFKWTYGSATVSGQANFAAMVKHSGTVTRIDCKTQPTVTYQFLSQSVSAVVLEPSLITMELPRMIDACLAITNN